VTADVCADVVAVAAYAWEIPISIKKEGLRRSIVTVSTLASRD
jgi:hypothetical protein